MHDNPSPERSTSQESCPRSEESETSLIAAAKDIAQGSRRAAKAPEGTRLADVKAVIDRLNRKEQEKDLIEWAEKEGLVQDHHGFEAAYKRLQGTSGQESDVYFCEEDQTYRKMNSGIAYKDWIQFFEFIELHNLLFPATAYTLLGFSTNDQNQLHAHLSQPAVACLQEKGASRYQVNKYMERYGFTHIGYDHYDNGCIQVMDLHDENVLVGIDDHLFFIDTSIYIKEQAL